MQDQSITLSKILRSSFVVVAAVGMTAGGLAVLNSASMPRESANPTAYRLEANASRAIERTVQAAQSIAQAQASIGH